MRKMMCMLFWGFLVHFLIAGNAQVLLNSSKSLAVMPVSSCIEYGDQVLLQVQYKIPQGDQPLYIFSYSFENTAPLALAKKLGLSGDSKIQLYTWKNIHRLQESEQSGEFRYLFDTSPLLPGDYQIGMALKVSSGQGDGKSYTLRTRFPLAITRPAVAGRELQFIPGQFQSLKERKVVDQQTLVEAGNDHKNVFFRITCLEPEPEKLQTSLPQIWNNDCIEICLVPPGSQNEYFYKLIINPNGKYSCYKSVDDNAVGRMVSLLWEGVPEVNTRVEKDCWIAEVAIPFFEMEYRNYEQEERQWKFAVFRGRRVDGKTSEYSSNSLAENTSDVQNFLPLSLAEVFRGSDYHWEVETEKGTAIPEGDQFFYQTKTRIMNSTGEFRFVNLVAGLYRDHEKIAESRQAFEFLSGNAIQIPIRLPFREAGEYQLKFQIRGFDDSLYYQQILGVQLKAQTISLAILPPVMDNLVYATMQCPKIKVRVEDHGQTMDSMVIGLAGKSLQVTLQESVAEVELDIGDLPFDQHVITAKGSTGETSLAFRKLPPHPGETRIDANGITKVDGKPFIPYGWMMFLAPSPGGYMYDDNLNQTAVSAQYYYEDGAAARKVLDRAQTMNLKVIIYPYPRFNSQNKIFAKRHGSLTVEQEQGIIDFVESVKSHPALLGWYVADEPEGRDYDPGWFKQVRELVNHIDPFHPCFMVNYRQAAVTQYHEGGNILLPDVYVHYYKDTLKPRYPIRILSQFVDFCRQYKPTWMIVQAFACRRHDHPLCRVPDAIEFRNQVYQVFAADGKGVLLWAYPYSQMYHSMRETSKFVGAELQAIGEILLQPNQNDRIKVSETDILCSLKQLDDQCCIIAVNTQPREINAGFMVKANVKTLHVVSENRLIEMVEGGFSDTFLPYATHIYRSGGPVVHAEGSLQALYEKIAFLEKSRFKPGNLVSIGEQTANDLIQFRQNGNPETMPSLTASSDLENYYHKATGTLNYLIDGLIEEKPFFANQYWRPASGDKTPWLKITLPKTAKVHEVKLYTPEQRLEKAGLSVFLDGQIVWQGRAERQGGELIFQFPAVAAKELQVEIEESSDQTQFPLLTEIEVYGEYEEK